VVAERDEIDLAIAELDTKADAIVRETAAIIFLSTAISQFGKLDGLIVLGAQSRMVWKLAHLYSQRPAPGDLVRLYSQVATTAFVAGALEEIDLNEVVQPVVSTAFGSMAGSIPGLGTATTLLSTSVLTGTANAFLTLRVGLIARRYCGAVVQQPAAGMRRAATVEAAGMLGGIVREGSSKLVKSFGGAAWNLGSQAAGAVGGRVKGTFTGVADRAQDLSGYFRRPRGAEPTA
jgi:hypothetical protein